MRKITRICMLALLIAVLLVPYDMAFASSGTKKRAASTEEPFLKKKDASILTGTSSTLTVYNVPDNSDVSYKSSDETILTVTPGEDNTCEFTGAEVGTAIITIKIQEPVFLFVTNTYTLSCKCKIP